MQRNYHFIIDAINTHPNPFYFVFPMPTLLRNSPKINSKVKLETLEFNRINRICCRKTKKTTGSGGLNNGSAFVYF